MKKQMMIVIAAGVLTVGSVALASDSDVTTVLSEEQITMEQAKEIALQEVDGDITSAEIDEDNGKTYYEIDVNDGTTEYEFEIDAVTGEIIDFEKEVNKKYTPQETGEIITEDEALTIAKEKAPNASLKEIELEQEKGWKVYDIELMDGNTKYEFDIDAVTGEIIEFEKEVKKSKQAKKENKEVLALTDTEQNETTESTTEEKVETETTEQKTSTLTAEDAIAIARQHATGIVTEIERDDDVFEIEMEDGDIEYEIEIDVFTGNVVSFEKDED